MSVIKKKSSIRQNISKQERQDAFLNLAACSVLFIPSINNFVNCFFQTGLGLSMNYVSEVSYIFCVGIGIFAALRFFLSDFRVTSIAFLMFLGVLLSYFIYPDMRQSIYDNPFDLIYNPVNKVCFFCLPVLIYSVQIKDYKKLFFDLSKWARVTVVCGVVTFYFVVLIKGRFLQYMVFSYFMLTAICVCFENFFEEKKKVDLVLFILGTFSILLCGARGAVLSLLCYVIIRNFFARYDTKYDKKLFLGMLCFVLLFVITLFWRSILDYLKHICEFLKVDSRFITALIEGTLGESSGRISIFESIWKGLKANPFGYGIFGDRYVLGTFGFGEFTYAHNVFLEVICSFGFFFGIILIGIFIYKFFKALTIKNKYYNRFLWALIPYGFFQLFFSSSAIENVVFYMICTLIFNKRIGKEEQYEDC